MEHGLHLVDREQRGSVLGGRIEAAHVVDDGALHHAVVVIGTLHLIHPCALSLGGAWEIVGHKHSQVLALSILHVIDGNLGIILGRIFHLGESDAVELVGNIEDAVLHHAVEFKVRTNLILAEAVALSFHLAGIVIVVPRLELEVGTMGVGILLHVGNLLVNLLDCWSPNLHEQVLGILHGLSHHRVASIVGIGLKSQQASLALTQLENLVDVLAVVPLIAVAGSGGVHLVHLLAQVAVVGIVEHCQACGSRGSERPSLMVALLGELGSTVNHLLRETRELSLVSDIYHVLAHLAHHVLAKSKLELRLTLVDLLEFFLEFRREKCALAHEALVVLLHQALLHWVETHLVGIVIDHLDAREQALVHVDLIAVSSHNGSELLGDGLHLGGSIALIQSHKHCAHLII